MARSSWRSAAAALALLVPVAACGGGNDDVSDDDVATDLSIELQGDGVGLNADDADCVADVLVEELGADTLQDIDLTADGPPEDEQEAFAAAVQQAISSCDVDLSTIGQ